MIRLALAALCVAALGCNPAGNSTEGPQVFANICATCHGPTGKPNEVMIAKLGVHDLTAPDFRKRVTPELVEHQIRTGSANKLMPALGGALTDAQIAAVAAFVASESFVNR